MKNLFTIFTKAVIIALIALGSASSLKAQYLFEINSIENAPDTTMICDWTWTENGEELSFGQLSEGKVCLVNIWGSWCGPCKSELPDLAELGKIMPTDKYLVVGVAIEQKTNAWDDIMTLIEQNEITYRNFHAPKTTSGNLHPIYKALNSPQFVPTTLIIDRTGHIVDKMVGPHSTQEFKAAMEQFNSVEIAKSDDNINIYPNPAADSRIYIGIPAESTSRVSVEITDITGRSLIKMEFPAGSALLPIDIYMLSAGNYYAKIIYENNVYVKNVAVIK
ncbi:MAG: redoxin domain-containing protein [Bacteroidota bacterium]